MVTTRHLELILKVLADRIRTALILAIVFVLISTQSSTFLFSIIISVTIIFMGWEWAALAGFASKSLKILWMACLSIILALAYLALGITSLSSDINTWLGINILIFGALFWICCPLILYAYPEYSAIWNTRYRICVLGIFALIPAWCGMIFLKYFDSSGLLILLLVILVAAADIGAYFSGKAFGRRKLALKLSPNKTWEGVLGGFVSCSAIAIPLAFYFIPDGEKVNALSLLLLNVTVVFFSIIGDLLESILESAGYGVGVVDQFYTEETRDGLAQWQDDFGFKGGITEVDELVNFSLISNPNSCI